MKKFLVVLFTVIIFVCCLWGISRIFLVKNVRNLKNEMVSKNSIYKVKSNTQVNKINPITIEDFGIEAFDIGKPISQSEIEEAFGEPIRIYNENEDTVYQFLSFTLRTSIRKGKEVLNFFEITGHGIKTRRGLTVDDPIESITKTYGFPNTLSHGDYKYLIPVENNYFYSDGDYCYIISFCTDDIPQAISNIDIRIERVE